MIFGEHLYTYLLIALGLFYVFEVVVYILKISIFTWIEILFYLIVGIVDNYKKYSYHCKFTKFVSNKTKKDIYEVSSSDLIETISEISKNGALGINVDKKEIIILDAQTQSSYRIASLADNLALVMVGSVLVKFKSFFDYTDFYIFLEGIILETIYRKQSVDTEEIDFEVDDDISDFLPKK